MATGDVFVLGGCTHGVFEQLPLFEQKQLLLTGAGFGRCFAVAEQLPEPDQLPTRHVLVFDSSCPFPAEAEDFQSLTEDLRAIAVGKQHVLALTAAGDVYSSGHCEYGSVGQGGCKSVSELLPVPALRGKRVRTIACCADSSLAITHGGDAYTWGQGFSAETALKSVVATVPRYSQALSQLKILQVSCGDAHCLARTEAQTCAVWGSNTTGQLGIGHRSKPQADPIVLPDLHNVRFVAAGWSHSVALCDGNEGKQDLCFVWGLNSHGQLGLGDTTTRFSPQVLQYFATRQLSVEQCACNRATTVFLCPDAYLAGRLPALQPGEQVELPDVLPGVPSRLALASQDLPRRTTEEDPPGCCLEPLKLNFARQLDPERPPGQDVEGPVKVQQLVASDHHFLAFVPSSVVRVEPELCPIEGGTKVQVFVTGLACERTAHGQLSIDHVPDQVVDDPLERLKVRLRCEKPATDVTIPARCIGKNRLVIIAPDLSLSPIAPRAHGGAVRLSVQASMDGGLHWTEDVGVTLTYYAYPQQIVGVSPNCGPVTGDTKLKISVPGLKVPGLPTGNIVVAFSCIPRSLSAVPSGPTPFEQDLDGAYVAKNETLKQYPPVGKLDILAYGTYDHRKEMIEVSSPPFDLSTFEYYSVEIEASLDGERFLDKALPFTPYDLKLMDLEPRCGPLKQETRVSPVTSGLVKTDQPWIQAAFPEDVFPLDDDPTKRDRRQLPGLYDETSDRIFFQMPSLLDVVRERVELATANLPEPLEQTPDDGEDPDGQGQKAELAPPPVDPDGGLNGLPVVIELSLNGQQYTKDALEFIYYGELNCGKPQGQDGQEFAEGEALAEDTALLCPMTVPAGLTDQSAFIRLTLQFPDETTEQVKLRGTLHYTTSDEAALEIRIPTVKYEGTPPVDATVELTLNDQHWHEVPGTIKIQTVAPDPPPES